MEIMSILMIANSVLLLIVLLFLLAVPKDKTKPFSQRNAHEDIRKIKEQVF
jgi:hypothetical protein